MSRFNNLPSLQLMLLMGLLIAPTKLFGALTITEFMAANDSGLADEDGDHSDWIEIHNSTTGPISLEGYHLTDNPQNLDKWTFPAVTLQGGSYLIIFASGKNRVDPTKELHTNFNLSADGEYLGLTEPGGRPVVSEFAPSFPPQFEDESFGLANPSQVWAFFSNPTPGSPNNGGTPAGPIITALVVNPAQPVVGPLTVTARVLPANDSISLVKLFYRRMFENETAIVMNDGGENGDAVAGDQIWTAVIPESAFIPGEMTRWRFLAADSNGIETKEPAFRDPLDSHEYFGIVTHDPGIETLLPVLHWFTSDPDGAGTISGSRGAVYYSGEFYDNIYFDRHGQSSTVFPKKSYNIDFNRTQRFSWNTNAPRVADIKLLSNWADKSKVRHVLAYEVMRESGVAAHFAYTVRVEQNGTFFSTADIVEDADEIYLTRAGLNVDGALYKIYQNLLNKDLGNRANSGVEKKTRKFEGNQDLQQLIDSLDLTGPALINYIYDNIDIPRCVNFLAANSVIRNVDLQIKNWYLYRDTGHTDEWALLPWDLDLSHGRAWNEQYRYYDNALYVDAFVVTGESIRLVSYLFEMPATRAMIFRRIRTLSDQFLQPPLPLGASGSDRYYERRLNEQLALIDSPEVLHSDARLDFEKWGFWGVSETMAEAIQRWKQEYLPGRRDYIYNTQVIGKGGEIPLPQTDYAEAGGIISKSAVGSNQPLIQFGSMEVSPVSGDQDQEYIQFLNSNPIPVDISNWRLAGGINHAFAPGTVLPPNGTLYVCPDSRAFRARSFSPKGGEGHFVQGGYTGHLSNLGETIILIDDLGMTNNTMTYQGDPSDAQRYLVVSEVMYNPVGDGQTEFIELLNTSRSVTLNLTGIHFTSGVDFTFTGSGITSLAPGERVVIVRDLAAFQMTYGPGLPIGGVFVNDTALSNGGERIKIEDADNVTIQDFTFDDADPWPPGTDGLGYSLVLITPQLNPDHRVPGNWRPSARSGGSPGNSDIVPFPTDPLADSNGNGEADLIDYALGNDLEVASIHPNVVIEKTPVSSTTILLRYPVSLGAEQAKISVLASTDLNRWQDAASFIELISTELLGDGRAILSWRMNPLGTPQLFIRLQFSEP